MKVYAKTIVAMLCILAFNYLISLHPALAIDANLLQIFFNLFAMIYAIIAGFAIYSVLNNYNEIKYHMNNEVNALQCLRDYLMYVDHQEDVKKDVVAKIRDYVDAVIDKEWRAMQECRKTDMDTPRELYQLMAAVNTIQPANDSDNIALGRLIANISDITTQRTNRLAASLEKLPTLMHHLILTLSLFIMFTFTFIPTSSFYINMALNALNSFGIAFIYFMIVDLDYPFSGVWSITPEPFMELRKKLQ